MKRNFKPWRSTNPPLSTKLTTIYTDSDCLFGIFKLFSVLSMFMLSLIFVIACGICDWKRICVNFLFVRLFVCLFVYICIVIEDPGISDIRNVKDYWISLIDLMPPHCFPCQNPETWISIGICHLSFCIQWFEK
jgi:hypothetical protein